jgi:hypothetical protein
VCKFKKYRSAFVRVLQSIAEGQINVETINYTPSPSSSKTTTNRGEEKKSGFLNIWANISTVYTNIEHRT